MPVMYGYGEDSLTLWALQKHLGEILDEDDKTPVSDCLVFYRPSFGRSGGSSSPEFGEFDAIVATKNKVYLVESKWDNFSDKKVDRELIKDVQRLRHKVFSWYLTHWNKNYFNNWQKFTVEQGRSFKESFKDQKIIAVKGLLTQNLEQVLNMLLNYCIEFAGEYSIQNVLLFFHGKSKSQAKAFKDFKPVNIDYSSDLQRRFVKL